ncbi:MAG: methylenetetrahydrofolate reductase [Solobacterium sp.]|nr:methylenetetrahydrofolate reductase [NAD(P)H] [Solobacterium sp.]
MKIKDVLQQDKVTFSIEVFPPKQASKFDTVKQTVETIATLSPDFISVTYGAGGSTVGATGKLATEVQQDTGVVVMPHLTCVASTKEETAGILSSYVEHGIENIMALRGDIPEGGRTSHEFEHAVDLIHFIREHTDLCIGGACYPEGHPESISKADDIAHLKEKVDAGVDFLTTQMFFDNTIFYNFLYRIREAGIEVPVLAGIMPITDARQLKRSIQLSGTNVPERFRAIVDHFGSNPEAMKQAGIIYASDQIIDLVANGIRHIHLYSMNKPEVAEGILRNITELLK